MLPPLKEIQVLMFVCSGVGVVFSVVAGAQDVRTGVVKGSCAVARNGVLVVGVVGGGEAAVFVVDATVCTDLFFSFFFFFFTFLLRGDVCRGDSRRGGRTNDPLSFNRSRDSA